MNINEPSDTTEANTEYASQWIDYLKKKNTILTIVWPILLATTIICAIAVFYFHQQSEAANNQVSTLFSDLEASNKTNDLKSTELEQVKQVIIKLKDKIALLNSAKTTLEQQKGDSASQLGLSSQMVEALKEKNAALESENALISSALSKSKSLTVKQNKNLATKVKAHNKERFTIEKKYRDGQIAVKALMSRQKEMQAEMHRLADLSEQQKKDMSLALIAKNKVEAALKLSETKLTNLESDYKNLDESLKLAVEPISTTSKASLNKKVNENNVSDQARSELNSSDGLEEIRTPITKPAKKQKESKTSAVFDHDQISIEN